MTPLLVTACMRGPVTGAPMIDGLLAFVVAQQLGLVAGFGQASEIDIPIASEPCGRFHLCSSPACLWVQRERRWVNRRFPLHEAQLLGDAKLRRVHLAAGPTKSYRIPHDVAWAEGDAIQWWCVGDREGIRDLLQHITHLGRRRAVGRGAVDRWQVDPCEPWGDGFPVVRDGRPLRPLPMDWPGLVEPSTGYHTLTFPYYSHERETLCAVPDAQQ